jgi:hypothetical protein
MPQAERAASQQNLRAKPREMEQELHNSESK